MQLGSPDQFTSVLRYPVFIDGQNYNGTANMLKHPLLRQQLMDYFGEDARGLSRAAFIPLGDKVVEVLRCRPATLCFCCGGTALA